ncbi:ATP12 family chaperone protein [Benzoatithermus flavus]|uniref:ATP12 family protein n=1 Tax=Benzoatithermus flavus TaxID=3108223 RepID=A0ABU8XYN2_9PROT
MQRFYKDVAVGAEADGFTVLLDGKPVRTPARRLLLLPTRALAEAVAEEWRAQGETLAADAMRLTRLATTVVDLMPTRRGDAIEEVAGFADTDLLCYRASSPATLVERQEASWQPWLDWAERQYDARLQPASGIMPVEQSETALKALKAAVARLGDWRLVGLHAATTALGSLILGLALERGAIDGERAFETAYLDELFEIEEWGEDAEQTRRHERLRADVAAAERFLRLLAA